MHETGCAYWSKNLAMGSIRRLIIECIRGTTHGVCRAGENMTTSGSSDSLLLLLVGGDRLAARVRVIIFRASSSSWGRPHQIIGRSFQTAVLGRLVKLRRGRSSAGGAAR